MLREEKYLSEMRRKKIDFFLTLEKKNNKKQTNSSMYVAEMDYGERTPVVLINRERRGKNNTKRKEGNKVGGGPAKTQHKRTTKQRQHRHTQNMKINNEKKTKQKKHGAMAVCATEGETWEKQIVQAKGRVICSELLRKGTKGREGGGGGGGGLRGAKKMQASASIITQTPHPPPTPTPHLPPIPTKRRALILLQKIV